MSNAPEIVPLFATPLVIFDVPDAAALNAELRKVIEQREKSHPARTIPTRAAGSRAMTWTAGAARRPSSSWPSAATPQPHDDGPRRQARQ